MTIKNRIALYFTLISTAVLIIVLCATYFIFKKFLEADFYDRLLDRATITAKLYLEADEIDETALNNVRHQYLLKLNDEVIRVYNSSNKTEFIEGNVQFWNKDVIAKVRKERKIQFKEGLRQVVGIYYEDNQGNFVILASAIDQSSLYRLNKLLHVIIAIFIIIIIVLSLSGRWIASKMLRPLNLFTKEVGQIDVQNMEFRVQESDNKDEINQLAKTFNHLMDEIEQASVLERTFMHNASHELRTPLTRIMMTGELALMKERDTASYQKAVQSILSDAAIASQTLTGLLHLAKMDVELIHAQQAAINLPQLLSKLKSGFGQNNTLDIEIINEDYEIAVLANDVLLEIALNNMLLNAFKFSNNQPVICRLESSGQWVYIKIIDKGIGIDPALYEEIFKPFYSKSKENGFKGEGMGLYIAQKIVHLFKGNISITPNLPAGTVFTLALPRF